MNRVARIPVGGLLLLLAFGSGCATVPYHQGRAAERPPSLALRPGEKQIERGDGYWLLDGLGWILGIPSKIILLDSRIDNHDISPETEKAMVAYLQYNELDSVKVRLNEYAPGGEWSRLFRNKSVGWGWRYTVGVLTELLYTILPGRLFGGDHYNPFTDTVNLYSDHPAVALHEAGHAKDFAEKTHRGSYAFLSIIPFSSLYFEKEATGDAIGYLREVGTAEDEKAAYKVLYPAYFTYIGGGLTEYVNPATLIYFAVVIPGHIVGRVKASGVDERRAEEAAAKAAAPADEAK